MFVCLYAEAYNKQYKVHLASHHCKINLRRVIQYSWSCCQGLFYNNHLANLSLTCSFDVWHKKTSSMLNISSETTPLLMYVSWSQRQSLQSFSHAFKQTVFLCTVHRGGVEEAPRWDKRRDSEAGAGEREIKKSRSWAENEWNSQIQVWEVMLFHSKVSHNYIWLHSVQF